MNTGSVWVYQCICYRLCGCVSVYAIDSMWVCQCTIGSVWACQCTIGSVWACQCICYRLYVGVSVYML